MPDRAQQSLEVPDWTQGPSLDAWLIWNIWQVASPTLVDTVPVERGYRVHRETGIALTRRGAARPEAPQFAELLAGPEGARIFARWGWITPASR